MYRPIAIEPMIDPFSTSSGNMHGLHGATILSWPYLRLNPEIRIYLFFRLHPLGVNFVLRQDVCGADAGRRCGYPRPKHVTIRVFKEV